VAVERVELDRSMRLGENDYSVAMLHIAHAFDGVGEVVWHEDSNGGIVREIGVEMTKLWLIFEGIGDMVRKVIAFPGCA
jgi:hypothetical protein